MSHDIYLRVHTARPKKKEPRRPDGPRWTPRVLIFDCECRTDTSQELTIGVYRICRLVGDVYVCEEEGLFYGGAADAAERKILNDYPRNHDAAIGVKRFPPRLTLPVLDRATFIEKVFWKAVKRGDLIVAFNLPFDLSRLAVEWRRAKDGGWSLIFSQRRSRKTGRLEVNPNRPRIRITARNSQSAFLRLMRPLEPKEWPRDGRFLDLRTLAFALFDESYRLDRLCRELGIKGKLKHEPTGRISVKEIDYCREDVRATMDALNALKDEFDRHPIDLYPDRAYSPASIAKAYLDAMGVTPPLQKFKVPNQILGIGMQAYYGGRCETRLRLTEVPVIPTDFTSNYPTVNALLGNWDVLTARSVSFEDVTSEIRAWLPTLTLNDLFNRDVWRKLSFFAHVRPNDDLLPVRAVYNGETKNIGLEHLTSDKPIWIAGPDLMVAVILGKKPPHIIEALRMVPHGQQKGLKRISLRGMVDVDPRRDDFFRHTVEQRHHQKKTNEALSGFLKTLGNAGSYGIFVEVNTKTQRTPKPLTFFAGKTRGEGVSHIVEDPGRWYLPPLAALITAGSRLLLAMLERCARDAGGTYVFCDTDSLCLVAGARERLIPCPGGPHQWRGRDAIKVVSYGRHVRPIIDRFVNLNPYDRVLVPGSILKIVHGKERPQDLLGFSVSAKRYVLYKRKGDRITLVDPKAHGLGYLYPPIDRADDEPAWTADAWGWMLREGLGRSATAAAWLTLPAMMRVTLSTPLVLDRLNRRTRPYNFVFCPLIDPAIGYPAGVDRDHFTLIAPFTKRRAEWWRSPCVNVHDGRSYRLALQQTSALDRVIPQTFASILRLYLAHPEAKSLAPNGTPCGPETRGLLRRASITAGEHRPILKESDRRWEHGEDLSVLNSRMAEISSTRVVADATLKAKIGACGVRALMRKTGLSQHTIEKIRDGLPVRRATLQRVFAALQ